MKKCFVVFCMFILFCSFANAGWDDFKKKAGNAIERTKEAGRKTRDFGKKAKKSWDDDAGRRKKIYNSVRANYKDSVDRIRDPEARRQAKEMIDKGLELRRKWKDTKRSGVENSVDALAMIPVGDGMTLGEMMVREIGNKYPGLEEAGLLDRDTAVAFGLGDRSFFVKEIEFIEKDGQRMSVYGAINEATPFDSDKTIKYLNIAGAAEGIYSADDIDGAVGSLFNAMDAVN